MIFFFQDFETIGSLLMQKCIQIMTFIVVHFWFVENWNSTMGINFESPNCKIIDVLPTEKPYKIRASPSELARTILKSLYVK